MIVPALIVVVGIQLYPLIYSFWLSFQDWSLTESAAPRGFVGAQNYMDALGQASFRRAARNTFTITVVSVILSTLLGTVLAFLTQGTTRTMRVSRTVLILPLVVAPVAAGTLWRLVLHSRAGLLNMLLGMVGIDGPEWLASSGLAVVSVIMLDVWIGTPFVLLLVSAALTGVPDELVESAQCDGASVFAITRSIELPLIAPVLVLAMMFRTLESILSLDTVITLTFGGPGFATYTMTFLIYATGLRSFRLGSAAAMSWIFMAVVVVVLIVAFSLQRRWSTD